MDEAHWLPHSEIQNYKGLIDTFHAEADKLGKDWRNNSKATFLPEASKCEDYHMFEEKGWIGPSKKDSKIQT